jgi:hypothetical protein
MIGPSRGESLFPDYARTSLDMGIFGYDGTRRAPGKVAGEAPGLRSMMRRAITEWGLVVSGLVSVALGLVWVDSRWIGTLQEPLALGPHLFLRVNDGQLCFFSELGARCKPTLDGPDRPDISWVRHYSTWMLPGMEYHSRLLANGETIWSLEVAIVIPLAVLLIAILIFWRIRWGRWGIGRWASPLKS